MPKSKLTIRTKKSKHNLPKEFIQFIEKLKGLEFVICVGTAPFKPSKKKNGVRIVGFDDTTNSYILRVIGEKFEQKLFVNVIIPKGYKKLEEEYKELKEAYEETIKNVFYEG